MELERVVEEYVKEAALAKSLDKVIGDYKKMLVEAVDKQGEPDAKGHRWLTVGRYLLQRQKRQGEKFINKERAEDWAKARGVWDEVKVVREELDEDALLAYMYEHRRDEELEVEFQDLYDTPQATWAFMPVVEEKPIDY